MGSKSAGGYCLNYLKKVMKYLVYCKYDIVILLQKKAKSLRMSMLKLQRHKTYNITVFQIKVKILLTRDVIKIFRISSIHLCPEVFLPFISHSC